MDPRSILVEDKERGERWKYLTEGKIDEKDRIGRRDVRVATELLLDNMAEFIARKELAKGTLFEDTVTASFAPAFTTFAFPLVRRVFPRLIANDLVSVQPMKQPTGKAWFMDTYYSGDVDRSAKATFDKTYADATEGGTVKEVHFKLSSVDISAGEKKLKTTWTIEAEQDILAYHGLNIADELLNIMSDELVREIDRTIIDDMVLTAGAGNVGWVKTHPAVAPWTSLDPKIYDETLFDAMVDADLLVFKRRYRKTTWAVAGPDVCARFEKLNKFRSAFASPMESQLAIQQGIHLFGALGSRWTVYCDPWFQDDKILLGFKGASFLEAGYVYAPYVPVYTTPAWQDPNTFKTVRGMMSRFAKKNVVPEMYATVTLTTS
jgi:hypothetical protein